MTRPPADHAVAKCPSSHATVSLDGACSSHARACFVLLEPPAVLIAATDSTELLQELVQDADVGLCCRALSSCNSSSYPDDVSGALGTPDSDIWAVKRCLFDE